MVIHQLSLQNLELHILRDNRMKNRTITKIAPISYSIFNIIIVNNAILIVHLLTSFLFWDRFLFPHKWIPALWVCMLIVDIMATIAIASGKSVVDIPEYIVPKQCYTTKLFGTLLLSTLMFGPIILSAKLINCQYVIAVTVRLVCIITPIMLFSNLGDIVFQTLMPNFAWKLLNGHIMITAVDDYAIIRSETSIHKSMIERKRSVKNILTDTTKTVHEIFNPQQMLRNFVFNNYLT